MTGWLTPTQRATLFAVLAGDIVQGPDEHGTVWAWRIDPPFEPRRVEHSIRRLQHRGLVDLVEARWKVTVAGRRALAGAS